MDVKKGILLIALGMGSMFAIEAADRAGAEEPLMQSAQPTLPLDGVRATAPTADATHVLVNTPNG